jgi:plastocyanin
MASAALLLVGCRAAPELDTSLGPDSVLMAELGLTSADRVHRVRLSGGEIERADPAETEVAPGAYVEFITTDWLIHEVVFEADSMSAEQWAFLERTDQVASPPLIDLGSRYVLTFAAAPPGRYPFTLEGNGRPGRGAIVVAERPLAPASRRR